MRKVYSFLLNNSLAKGSFILLIASVFSNISGYLFHLIIGRMLGPESYGVLQSYFSIFYFLGIPMSVFGILIVKIVSANSNDKLIEKKIVDSIFKPFINYGAIISGLLLFLFPFVGFLIKDKNFIIYFGVIFSAYIGIFQSIYSSIFYGLLQFKKNGFISIISGWSRLIICVAFVFILFNFKIFGVIIGTLLSTLLSLWLCWKIMKPFLIHNIKTSKKIPFNLKKESIILFFVQISMVSLYSVDVILARHYLPPFEAGGYAALSVLGKIILFASSPIISVMLPIIIKKYTNKENYHNVFVSCFAFIALASLFIVLLYVIFPIPMVRILFGNKYIAFHKDLMYMSIFFTLYSLVNLLSNYFISISKTVFAYVLSVGAVFQIIFINIFHKSIRQITIVNILVCALLFLSLLIYYFLDENKRKRVVVGDCTRI